MTKSSPISVNVVCCLDIPSLVPPGWALKGVSLLVSPHTPGPDGSFDRRAPLRLGSFRIRP